MKYYKIGIIIFTVFWLSSIDVAGQDKISYSEDIEEAISGFRTDQKLILAIYTEDEELQEEYFAYIDWHDSLVDLLNKEYTVYTENQNIML